jgi:hypothetical protein
VTKIARCTKAAEPDHRLATNNGSFLTSAEVVQGWRVDYAGNFIETDEECIGVVRKPNHDNYSCAVENCDGEVEWIDTDPPAPKVCHVCFADCPGWLYYPARPRATNHMTEIASCHACNPGGTVYPRPESADPGKACTCDGMGTCSYCNLPCGDCGKKLAALPLCECEHGHYTPDAAAVYESWKRDGILSVADDPNLGRLIVYWQMRSVEERLQGSPGALVDIHREGPLDTPPLLTVIQRWLRAGCPAVVAGPDPLRDLGLLRPGDGAAAAPLRPLRLGEDTARPLVPMETLKEWAKELKLRADELVDDDAAFDKALDIAMFGTGAVLAGPAGADVEQCRNFAYELLAAAGRPYGENLWDGTKVPPNHRDALASWEEE